MRYICNKFLPEFLELSDLSDIIENKNAANSSFLFRNPNRVGHERFFLRMKKFDFLRHARLFKNGLIHHLINFLIPDYLKNAASHGISLANAEDSLSRRVGHHNMFP